MKDREQRYLELIRDNRGRLHRLARAYATGEADRALVLMYLEEKS